MCFVWFETLQIPIVRCIKDCNKIVDNSRVFFLEDTLELTLYLIAVLVILAIVAHFVNEEKGEALYATVEKFFSFVRWAMMVCLIWTRCIASSLVSPTTSPQ